MMIIIIIINHLLFLIGSFLLLNLFYIGPLYYLGYSYIPLIFSLFFLLSSSSFSARSSNSSHDKPSSLNSSKKQK